MNTIALQSSGFTHRAGNLVKTGVLLAALSAVVLVLGQRLGGAQGLVLAGGLVAVMNFVSFWFSDRIALAMNGAVELPRGQLPWLHALVDALAHRAGIPSPRVYLVESATPNAFATGRSPEHAAVAVTTGLLERLDRRELTAVLAHELAHVQNRDTLIMTVAATLAGVITHLAQWAFFWGGSLLGRSDDSEEGGSGLATLGAVLVAPIAATLLQLAVSRSREFDADATAAQLTGDPEALASALARLEHDNRAAPMPNSAATAHLYIVNPLAGGLVASLFSTHPPMAARIERLLAMR